MRAAVFAGFAAVGVVVAAAFSGAADEDKPKKAKVKLAVLVVFDQFRGDYLDRWGAHFGDGGFKRLMADGAHFPDCHYPYANTSTGPGHASILAGCSANKHGVINNSWYDRAAAEEAYCAGTPRYEHVPPLPPEKEVAALDPKRKTKPVGVGTPDRMLGPTLADVLKATTGGKGKVFGLSLKDRAAVLPAGRKPDGAYWFDGRFGTSTAYRDSLPEWVTAFNKAGLAESYFGKDWTRFRDDLDYAQIVGRDDGPGEGLGAGPPKKAGQPVDATKHQGKTFPHPTTGGVAKAEKSYYDAVATSPFGNDLLLAFTKACVTAEKLGQDDAPDLLAVSFSSNDLVGHAWGPDSHEVLDITLRSDALMADLLQFLDKEVGPGNYSLVVTADHGVCPIPEAAAAAGNPDAKRVSPTALLVGAEKALQDAHGPVTVPAVVKAELKPGEPAPKTDDKKERNLWIEAVSAPNLYLNHRQVKAANLSPDAVAGTLAGHLRRQPGVLRAYTRAELLAAAPPTAGDAYWAPSKRSFHPDRSGDVVVVTAPFALLDTYAAGTSHGTPHSYDTHAVFLAFGPTIGGGRRSEKITPLHTAAILADALGVNPPANAEYGLPATLTEAPSPPVPPAR